MEPWPRLAPSVADRPGVMEWWGRIERFAGTPRTALAKARTIYELDLRHVLPLVAVPTLVIHSRNNMYVRAGHGRYLAENIAGARLLELDSADHWPLPDPEPPARSRSSSPARGRGQRTRIGSSRPSRSSTS